VALRTPFSVLRSGPSTAQNLDKDGVLHVQAVSDHPRKRPESPISANAQRLEA